MGFPTACPCPSARERSATGVPGAAGFSACRNPTEPALAHVVAIFLWPSETEFQRVILTTPQGQPLKWRYGLQGVNGPTSSCRTACSRQQVYPHGDVLDAPPTPLLVGERHHVSKIISAPVRGLRPVQSDLPDGENQRGSADVVLGTRELTRRRQSHSRDGFCPAGPYHFQPPRMIKDSTGTSTMCDSIPLLERIRGTRTSCTRTARCISWPTARMRSCRPWVRGQGIESFDLP